MNTGLVPLFAIAALTAGPVRAAAVGDAVPVDRSPAAVRADAREAQAAPVPVDGAPTPAIEELAPLGPPTGARDELALKPSGPTSVIPEPATLAVFGVGLLLLFRRRSAT